MSISNLIKKLIYLSPMHINQRTLTGWDILDDHEDVKNLNTEEKIKT
jgi:hypothetical protein